MSFWSDVGNNLASCFTWGLGGVFILGAIVAFFVMHSNVWAVILLIIGIVILAMSAAFSKKAQR